MRRSIHVIELVLYALLGLVLVLDSARYTSDPQSIGQSLPILLFGYVFYARLMRGYGQLDGCTKLVFLFFFWLIFLPCDVVRRIAFIFYQGEKPVIVAIGRPLVKRHPAPTMMPQQRTPAPVSSQLTPMSINERAAVETAPPAFSKPKDAMPTEQAPAAKAAKIFAAIAIMALVTTLVFVLLLYGAYRYRDRIKGWFTGNPPTVTPTPTARIKPTVTATLGPAKPTPVLSTYYDDKAHITMGYPDGWQFEAGPTSACVNWQTGESQYGISFFPERPGALPQVSTCVFEGSGAFVFAARKLVDDYLTQYESSIVQDERFSGFQAARRWEDLIVGGRPAVALGYSATVKNIGDIFAVVMFTATDQTLYLVTWSGRVAEQGEITARFEAMRQTIQFLP
jgi:hypothetical protein